MLGLYVVLEEPFPAVGETIEISFCLPNDPHPIACRARVAWHNPLSVFKGLGVAAAGLPPGCGLAFVGLSPDDKNRIDARVQAAHAGLS